MFVGPSSFLCRTAGRCAKNSQSSGDAISEPATRAPSSLALLRFACSAQRTPSGLQRQPSSSSRRCMRLTACLGTTKATRGQFSSLFPHHCAPASSSPHAADSMLPSSKDLHRDGASLTPARSTHEGREAGEATRRGRQRNARDGGVGSRRRSELLTVHSLPLDDSNSSRTRRHEGTALLDELVACDECVSL